jgi:hypothetical protein
MKEVCEIYKRNKLFDTYVPMNAGVHGCEINMGSSGKPICRLSRNH